ncbi:hypothetical protein TVVG_00048 [Tetraselmis viridis virus SI1]|uniref:exonuclease VIII n=1 Tax=Tetraselmis viridis virus S20 TaxID=754070 RepID=UPI0002C0FEEE|nr:exonuclease VIII [Tetraselmis viridis virus S20]AGH31342.1 hypothetical protein TVGG_00014 [Tetraselmis viridis virus S20]AGH31430.1 hypothetical protein TVVG_00048 [Tetraselmis viridis virus SI1]
MTQCTTIEDGVYIGLPHEDYLAIDRLGSTDHEALYSRREGWWWSSPHNPYYVRKDQKHFTFGSGLHTLMLEGQEAYEHRFAVMPVQTDYPDLLISHAEIKEALERASVSGIKPRMTKPELIELARVYIPEANIWDAIMADWKRKNRNREHLTAEDDHAIRTMFEAAMADEDMRAVCIASGGVRLTELSVFWTTEEGLKCRFRFDSLLPSWIADLKSIQNSQGKDLRYAIGDRIANDHLDVQAAMSFEARRALYRFLEEGREPVLVHGDQAQVDWLKRYPKEAPLMGQNGPGWHFIWVFYQKPDTSGIAPVLFPLRCLWGSERHLTGWRKYRQAQLFYLDQVKRFGLDKPWSRVSEAHGTEHTDTHRVMFPPWEKLPDPTDGETEALEWRTT